MFSDFYRRGKERRRSLDEQEGSTLRRVMQRFVEGKWNTSHSFATSEQRAQVALKLEELFRSVDLDGPRIDELICQTLTK